MSQNEKSSMSSLIPVERRKRILDILKRDHSVRVVELSELFDVSEVTIRRDLELMEEEGLLSRSYGGAVIGQHLQTEQLYANKSSSFQNEKELIGALAATLVNEGETLFVGSGTTTLKLFQHLGEKKAQIITPNAGLITENDLPELDYVMIGGNYRKLSHAFVGTTAMFMIQHFHASKCFIGADGLSVKHGLTSASVDEAIFVRTMVEQTKGPVIVLADSSKFGTVASAFTIPIATIDIIITDEGVDEGYIQDLNALGVEVMIAR